MKKNIVGFFLFAGVFVSPIFVHAAGLTETQIQSVLALLNSFGVDSGTVESVKSALTGAKTTVEKPAFCYNFNSDLTVGSAGEAVTALGKALSLAGISTGGERFDEGIAANVVLFQAKHGIRQTGYVGPITRKKLNALHRCYGNQTPVEPVQPVPFPPLQKSSITVVSPNGGGYWYQGEGVEVEWKTKGIPSDSQMAIRLRHVETSREYNLATSPNDGTEKIKLSSEIPVGAYTLVIKTVVNDRSYADASDSYFKVVGVQPACPAVPVVMCVGESIFDEKGCLIGIKCGASEPVSTVTFTASPTSGPAPLVVTFSVPAEMAVLQSLIDFGDKTSSKSLDLGFGCANTGSGSCPPVLVSHTYDFVGTYKAALINKPSAGPCPSGASCMAPAEQILGTVTIKVTSGSI